MCVVGGGSPEYPDVPQARAAALLAWRRICVRSAAAAAAAERRERAGTPLCLRGRCLHGVRLAINIFRHARLCRDSAPECVLGFAAAAVDSNAVARDLFF